MAYREDRRTLFLLEAKTGPNHWLDVQEVYGLEEPPARHPDREAAVRAKSVPEPLLKSNRLAKPKCPIRVRELAPESWDAGAAGAVASGQSTGHARGQRAPEKRGMPCTARN